MINIQRRPSPYPHPSGTANFQAILNSTTPRGGRVGGESNYCPHTLGVTHMGQFGTMGLTPLDTWWHRIILWTHLGVRTEPCLCRTLGVRGSRGEFFVVRDTFFWFPIFCDSFAVDVQPPVLRYHFFAHSPRGAVGGGVAEPRFSPGFAPAVSKLACACTQFRLFVSVLTLLSAPLQPRLPPFLH